MVLSMRRVTTTWGYDDAGVLVAFGFPKETRKGETVARHDPTRHDYYTGRFMYGRSAAKTRDGGGILGIASMARRFDRLTSGLIYR